MNHMPILKHALFPYQLHHQIGEGFHLVVANGGLDVVVADTAVVGEEYIRSARREVKEPQHEFRILVHSACRHGVLQVFFCTPLLMIQSVSFRTL